MSEGLNFLCVGVQKAGTTWLYENLQKHPDVWLSPVKEVHYFDRSLNYQSTSYLFTESFFERIFSHEKHNIRFRKMFLRTLLGCLRFQSWRTILWKLKFVFGRYNDEWYSSLFKGKNEKIVGEITPSYSFLDEADVKIIRAQYPSLKIVLLLRNPIERVWSNIRYKWSRKLITDLHNREVIIDLINSNAVEVRTDYIRIVDTWLSCFPSEQMFVGFYDDLVRRPDWLFSEILKFLDVEKIELPSLNERVNPSKKGTIPKDIQIYLAKKYLNQLEQLSDTFGGHATSWLDEARLILTE